MKHTANNPATHVMIVEHVKEWLVLPTPEKSTFMHEEDIFADLRTKRVVACRCVELLLEHQSNLILTTFIQEGILRALVTLSCTAENILQQRLLFNGD